MSLNTFIKLTSLAAVSGLLASAASAQIANGSFESEPLPQPDRVSITSATGWTGTGLILLERGVNGTSNIAAHTGSQFVSMGHNGSQGDTLSQLFNTVIGTTYTVSFQIACIQGDAFQSVQAVVSSESSPSLGSVTASVSSISQGWVGFSFNFTADNTSVLLRFVHTLGADNANVALDSVNVIPSPASLSLLTLAGLASTRRRR